MHCACIPFSNYPHSQIHLDNIQPGPVIQGFSQVGDRDILHASQIGNCASQFKDAMVGTGGKLHLVHGSTDQAAPGFIHRAKTPDLCRMHVRIARYSHVSKTLPLNLTSSLNPFSYISRRLPKLIISEFLIFNTRNFNVDVNPIKKRT